LHKLEGDEQRGPDEGNYRSRPKRESAAWPACHTHGETSRRDEERDPERKFDR
jgi:hypothetical protein